MIPLAPSAILEQEFVARMFECGTHDEKGQRKKGNNKNKQKGPEHFHVTWTATQVQYAPTTAFRTGGPTRTVLGQIPGPTLHSQAGSPYRWEPVRFDRLPIKPVRSGSGLGRYQTGPNSKFKFEFKK